ncbi:MAG: flagellar motor protein MotB [Phycisphaerales bacterium]
MSKRQEESAPAVPLWIITFSDMTTNLLTFFVLLLSMGHVRDDSLFDDGQRISMLFLESVKEGFGFKNTTDFDYAKVKYTVDQPDKPQGTTKDAREEQTRRLFENLRRSMQTMPSQLKGDRVEFSVANIKFAPDQAMLDDAGKQWLSRFCLNVRQSLDPATTMLYVVGVADRGAVESQSRLLAARRSRAVAAFVRQALSASTPPRSGEATGGSSPWRVFWWGAGPGASWGGQDAPSPGRSQILIAAMKTTR